MRSNKVLVAAVAVLLALAGGVVFAVTSGDEEPATSLAVEVDDPAGVGDADAGDGANGSADDADARGPPAGDADGGDPAEGDIDGSFGDGDSAEGGVDGEFDDGFGVGDESGGGDDDVPEQVRYSDLPTISVFDLPSEAIDTLDLIERGGPYPYRQDDGVFQNREGILPDRDLGHYREYTVETPGSPDRGARRIVAGADGERYWTTDHYASFEEIVFE